MGCGVLGRGAEPLVRAQFVKHPPSLNFGANHLKKGIRDPQKPPSHFFPQGTLIVGVVSREGGGGCSFELEQI